MTESAEKVITTTCASHCGGTCVLKVHVKNAVITRIETDDGQEPQMRACLKGRAYRQRVYAPDRLRFPMKRVGARGQGKFERTSWDDALDTVARELMRVKDTYGPASILYASLFVRPVVENASPTTTEPKMNMTDGSIKSLKASFAERMLNNA